MLEPDVTTLYKYKPLNEYTMDIIVSDNIYYPKPARFNDPFDTKCFFRNTSEIVNSSRGKEIFGDDDIAAFRKNNRLNDIQAFQSELAKFGVLSLAASPQNTLMWSHYANDHKGICIGFERSPENILGKKLNTSKVDYRKSYPSLSLKIFSDKELLNKSQHRVLHTKSMQWEYEDEWRVIVPDGDKAYPVPGKIVSIVFGARISDLNKRIMESLLEGKSIDVFQAKLKQNEFGIKLEKVNM
jgi:hypothetical protein